MNQALVGYAAGGMIALSHIPQVLQAWQTKSTGDISLLWNIVYIIAMSLWAIYGWSIGSIPLIAMTSVEMLLVASLLTLKLRYG